MSKWPQTLTWMLMGALVLFGLRHHWIQRQHPYPVEYGEGVNLNWIIRAQTDAPLYPPVTPASEAQRHNPYPPLYPFIAALLNRNTDPAHPFRAARSLSLAATLIAAATLFSLIRKRTAASTAACAVVLFLLSPMMMRFGSMARVDPLGLACALLCVWMLDRENTPRQFFLAACLAAAAVLVKPTFIAAPLYVLYRLCQSRSQRADTAWPAALICTLAGALLPVLLVSIRLFSRETPHLLLHLWTLQGLPADPAAALSWLAAFSATHAPVLVPAILWAALPVPGGGNNAGPDPLRTYARLTLLAPCLTAWVSGSQENYLMEIWAIACVGAPCFLHNRKPFPIAGVFLQLLLFLPVAPAPVFTRTYGQELPSGGRSAWTPTRADAETGYLLQQEILSLSGEAAPMLSSDPGHLLAAGRDIVYQPYQFERLAQAGAWDPEPLHTAIAESHFSLILLKGLAETASDPIFSLETQSLIHTHYELHRVLGPWHLYRPAW